jgi:hypothetical protein
MLNRNDPFPKKNMNAFTPASDLCFVNRDNCPLDPGFDSTDNYMDYGDDYENGTI